MDSLLTDVHTHSDFSYDGEASLAEMLAVALRKGVCFYGVAEHYNYDLFLRTGVWVDGDPEEYFHKGRHLQEDYAGAMNVLLGYEYGYTDDPRGLAEYAAIAEKYVPDFIVNSIHALAGVDYYDRTPYYDADGNLREKDEVYAEYLSLVRRSLDAPYPYDIVGHVGYVTRYAPYEDKRLYLKKYSSEIDDILQTIIRKGKILEVNASNKGGVTPYLPQRDILRRYFDLGGRAISYASDAHVPERILEGRAEIVQTLKEIGFTYITVPCRGEYIKVEI